MLPSFPNMIWLTVGAVPFDRVSTALITQLSKACRNGTNHDDLLAVMQRFFVEQTSFGLDQQAFVHRLLRELYRVLQVNTSHTLTASPDELLRLPQIQRCLSLQVSLGYFGEERHQTLSAKCAWTMLNVRMVSWSFAFAFKKPADANGESEMNKPGAQFCICPYPARNGAKRVIRSPQRLSRYGCLVIGPYGLYSR